jgi:phospholipase/carboxylesterase
MSTFRSPVVATRGGEGERAPLVVLLHGRGSHESDIISLAEQLPEGFEYVAVRAPIPEGEGFAWFANRGIGWPLADSLEATMSWFCTWLDTTTTVTRPVVLVGFSGGRRSPEA